MYIATVRSRSSPAAVLLREGYWEGGQVKNGTLANLTKWPAPKIDLLRRLLRDEPLAPSTRFSEVVKGIPVDRRGRLHPRAGPPPYRHQNQASSLEFLAELWKGLPLPLRSLGFGLVDDPLYNRQTHRD